MEPLYHPLTALPNEINIATISIFGEHSFGLLVDEKMKIQGTK